MEDAFNTYELLKHPVPAPPPNAPPRLERSRTPCCTAASLLHVPATIPPVLPRPPLRASEERTCAASVSHSVGLRQNVGHYATTPTGDAGAAGHEGLGHAVAALAGAAAHLN